PPACSPSPSCGNESGLERREVADAERIEASEEGPWAPLESRPVDAHDVERGERKGERHPPEGGGSDRLELEVHAGARGPDRGHREERADDDEEDPHPSRGQRPATQLLELAR